MQKSLRRIPVLVLFVSLSAVPVETAQGQGSATFTRGVAAYDAREWDAARAIFLRLIEAEPDNHVVAAYLGRIALNQDLPEEGAEWLERAIEGDEDVADYHYWLSGAYGDLARGAGVPGGLFHARRMKKECERAIELEPAHTGARYRLVQYYLEVPGMFGGSARKALEIARELKTLDRQQGSQALILVYRAEEEHDLVVAEYRELIAAYPDELAHRTNLANYLIRLSRYEEAFGVCEGAMQVFPDHPVLLFFYGAIAAESGLRPEQGIEYLQACLRQEASDGMPSPGLIHYQLGRIYERQNQPERAIAEYEACLQEMPGYQRAVDALARLRPPLEQE